MEEIISTNELFDNSGTNNLPLNCAWVVGYRNPAGKKHVHKIAVGHFSGQEKTPKSMPKRFGEFPKTKSSLTAPCDTDEYPCYGRKSPI